MFAYIAGATFVLQRVYGMSAQGFSFVFGANSIGIVAMGQVGARLVRRTSPLRLLAVGIGLNLLGSTGVVVTVLTGLGRPFLIGSLWVMVSALGLVFPNATAIALSEHGDRAGSASAVLGLAQYIVGALAAPLVGLAGEHSAVPLGIVVMGASVAAATVFATTVVPHAMRQRVSVS